MLHLLLPLGGHPCRVACVTGAVILAAERASTRVHARRGGKAAAAALLTFSRCPPHFITTSPHASVPFLCSQSRKLASAAVFYGFLALLLYLFMTMDKEGKPGQNHDGP